MTEKEVGEAYGGHQRGMCVELYIRRAPMVADCFGRCGRIFTAWASLDRRKQLGMGVEWRHHGM